MNYDKGFFDSKEFRELLGRYEHSKTIGTSQYFGVEEFADLASYFMFIEKYEEAEEVLAKSKHLHPAASENSRIEIKLLLCKGEALKAWECFSQIGYAEDDETRILKAEILLALKSFREAREIAFEILQKAKPDQEIVYDALEVLLDCGFAQEALLICENILRAVPGKRSLLEVKAECLIEMQRIDDAVEIYNSLLDEDPYSTFYWEQLGHAYYMVKKYGKALECFEYESTINEDIEYAFMMQGYCYYFMQDYSSARKIFGKLCHKYPQSAMPLFYIALSYHKEGMNVTAIETFNKVIEIAEEGTIEAMLARVDKAILLEESNMQERAEDAISMAIMMHPDNMKQLVLDSTRLYELRDKENLTFDDMNILESKEWSQEEELFRLGAHLADNGYTTCALRVLRYTREFARDTSEIDAYIAYSLWKSGHAELIGPAVENALEEKSWTLFRLFGIPYKNGITTESFIEAVKNRNNTEKG